MKIRKEEARLYHSTGRKGKIEVIPTKPTATQRDLSLAYTPGVADVCLDIQENPEAAFEYTARGNLVAVITNGTAVLGLGNIGPLAGKPVMEGKGVLFKRFADIDVFDIELNANDPDDIVKICKALEPTFGGINLEDIKAPECFYIEEKLRKEMNIPVFHDDQHGTAIISAAGFVNALQIAGKKAADVKVVVSGAGAAGISCAELWIMMGVKRENILMVDSKGVIHDERTDLNESKRVFARKTPARTLADAIVGADVFLGVSVAKMMTQEMVRSMANNPIIFALANPDPEISYPDAVEARPDVIMATGRSDYPNQVNNVLGFPFIFRGALDVRARTINDEMKLAAAKALADLARQPVPDYVLKAYGLRQLKFGKDYIIPKPLDNRVLLYVAPAVAKAAIDTGVAGIKLDIDEYRQRLESTLGPSRMLMRATMTKARKEPRRVVFPEGDSTRVLKACQVILDEGIAVPVLLGDEDAIRQKAKELDIEIGGAEVINPLFSEMLDTYTKRLFELRGRKGVTENEAKKKCRMRNYFGAMMLDRGDVDGMVSGLTVNYPGALRPVLETIGAREGVKRVSGVDLIFTRNRLFFFADTTVNVDPTAEDLAEIATLAAETARWFDIEPRIAMLSFSNFGSVKHPVVEKVRKATELVKSAHPQLQIEGEMMLDTALVRELIDGSYPFANLREPANVLIFPDLNSGSIAQKLVVQLAGAESIGPVLMGMRKPVNILERTATAHDIVNMVTITVVQAQQDQAVGRGKAKRSKAGA
jgi:malate dehydrogenase (oxaloacetate-decarboxylating)(NADP+)